VRIINHDIGVSGRDAVYFNSTSAEASKYQVENVDEQAAMLVKSGDKIFALPLRLISTSGAPCHVVVRQ
jgi:kynurenine formamidase